MGYERVADRACSATTIRRRRDEWIEAGVIGHLLLAVLRAYDQMVGLELEDLAADGCITKAPSGGQCAGKSPVDRGKQGTKRFQLTDGYGIPMVTVPAQDLASGRVPISHEGLQQQEHWRTAAHLRDLLVESNILPQADRRLLLYERWLAERLAAVEDATRHHLLHRFATWHQLRRLRAKAEAGPLGRSPTHEARQQITQADAFLTWLAARDRTLDQCRQADLDAWHTFNYATRRPVQPFLRWCMDYGAMPRLALPTHVIKQDQAPMHQHRRLAVLRRALHDEALPLRTRTAAALVLLYAQPVSRIVRLTTADVVDDGDDLTVRLGDPPSPLPAPVADLVRAYLAEQPRLARVSGRSTAWLFPGRQPGQPMDQVSLLDELRAAGIPAQRGRASAIRQLVLQAPAPVVARALGYHDTTTTHLVVEAGGTWSRYASGERTPSPPGPI